MKLADRDQTVIWHPYTQHQTTALPSAIVRGEGAYLIEENGTKLLDLISSWWVNLHGHAHPVIAKAIYDQALTLEHIIFSSFTHEPAVQFAEELLKILASSFSKVFFSDNGSTAVEIALKMAYQFWRNQGEPKRTRFIAFENGYHGDTVGSMSVGKQSKFFSPYEGLFFPVDFFPYPATWMGDETIHHKEQQALQKIADYLTQYGAETAALIIEPLVQAAGGMHMCRPTFLQQLEKMTRAYGVLVIYDEVVTGFGRTGALFACHAAQTTPDIICLAKGISGGFLPLAVTACQEKIYQAFLGADFSTALVHGHSYTANPLGCAAGLASLKLLMQPETQARIQSLVKTHAEGLRYLQEETDVECVRQCGTIAAFNLKADMQYSSAASVQVRQRFQARGLLIRPLGNVIYFLPPYCTKVTELKNAYSIMVEELQGMTLC